MDALARLTRELQYNAWANRETLGSLSRANDASSPPPDRAVAILAHIAGVEWLWLRRLGCPAPALAVWPELSVARCAAEFAALSRAWREAADSLTDAGLQRVIAYTNSKGEPWSNTVEDVLTHVIPHSSYHRGQIALLLGQAGQPAAYTDYIEFIRRGFAARGWPT